MYICTHREIWRERDGSLASVNWFGMSGRSPTWLYHGTRRNPRPGLGDQTTEQRMAGQPDQAGTFQSSAFLVLLFGLGLGYLSWNPRWSYVFWVCCRFMGWDICHRGEKGAIYVKRYRSISWCSLETSRDLLRTVSRRLCRGITRGTARNQDCSRLQILGPLWENHCEVLEGRSQRVQVPYYCGIRA